MQAAYMAFLLVHLSGSVNPLQRSYLATNGFGTRVTSPSMLMISVAFGPMDKISSFVKNTKIALILNMMIVASQFLALYYQNGMN